MLVLVSRYEEVSVIFGSGAAICTAYVVALCNGT
jgi:hypothetical protein